MSKHKRKPVKAQPISANPLFPAVVALWFGAAFGLGSLAVRPSLLEDLVLKSHIDLVIPAAAPPLGITARILLALVLAALGAIIGIALARRLSRPKVEERERKRGAKDLSEQPPRLRGRDAHPDAPARRPISAHEELGEEQPLDAERPSGGLLANRRRALAIMDDEPAFVPHESAPLPGLEPVQPLDLASLSLPVDPPAEAQPSFADAAPAPAPSLDWTQAAPITSATPNAPSMPAAMIPVPLEPATANVPISPETAHLDGRQVFGTTPQPVSEAAPRQIFGVQADGDHVPQDFVKAAGFQTSVFDTPEPSPLFERPAELATEGAPAMIETATPQPIAVGVTETPVRLEAAHDIAPVMAEAAAPAPVEPLPSPSSLGMTDLAARLADSMRRRRERAQSAAAPAATSPMAEVAEPTVSSEYQPAAAELPTMPAAFSALNAEPEIAPAVPQSFQASPIVSEVVEPAVPIAEALPRFAPPAPEAPAPAVASPLAMPAAPQSAPFAAPSAPIEAAATVPVEDIEGAVETTLADVADDNPYASLLGLASARPAHVRIEEPELGPDAEIEPVVIFPGQTGQVVPMAPAAVQAPEEAGFRRFDSPQSAGQGQPVAGATAAPLIAPDEAAQALRAALSNLQRMSGAA